MVDMSWKAEYNNLIGRTFTLRHDCYVFYYDDERLGFPYIAQTSFFGDRPISEIRGKDINGSIPVSYLRAGAKFRLDSVFRQNIVSSVSPVCYYVFITINVDGKWRKLNAIYLTAFHSEPPMFDPELVSW